MLCDSEIFSRSSSCLIQGRPAVATDGGDIVSDFEDGIVTLQMRGVPGMPKLDCHTEDGDREYAAALYPRST